MDYEYTLVAKKGLKIYKIPPMDSNQGYYLDSWKREDKITEGTSLKSLTFQLT